MMPKSLLLEDELAGDILRPTEEKEEGDDDGTGANLPLESIMAYDELDYSISIPPALPAEVNILVPYHHPRHLLPTPPPHLACRGQPSIRYGPRRSGASNGPARRFI